MELGNLSSLQTLYLDRTLLNGELPATLAQLSGIQVFWFHNTQLCVPSNPTLVNWLAAIPNVNSSGVNCVDLTPTVTPTVTPTNTPVSYTHLDVYKRQAAPSQPNWGGFPRCRFFRCETINSAAASRPLWEIYPILDTCLYLAIS